MCDQNILQHKSGTCGWAGDATAIAAIAAAATVAAIATRPIGGVIPASSATAAVATGTGGVIGKGAGDQLNRARAIQRAAAGVASVSSLGTGVIAEISGATVATSTACAVRIAEKSATYKSRPAQTENRTSIAGAAGVAAGRPIAGIMYAVVIYNSQ